MYTHRIDPHQQRDRMKRQVQWNGQLFESKRGWWEFKEPTELLVATCIEEVLPQLEQAAASGSYAVGYMAYEAASAFDSALKTHTAEDLPYLYFALFDAPVLHETLPPSDQSWQIRSLDVQEDKSDFIAHIAAIKEQIAQGATYQVNYTYAER